MQGSAADSTLQSPTTPKAPRPKQLDPALDSSIHPLRCTVHAADAETGGNAASRTTAQRSLASTAANAALARAAANRALRHTTTDQSAAQGASMPTDTAAMEQSKPYVSGAKNVKQSAKDESQQAFQAEDVGGKHLMGSNAGNDAFAGSHRRTNLSLPTHQGRFAADADDPAANKAGDNSTAEVSDIVLTQTPNLPRIDGRFRPMAKDASPSRAAAEGTAANLPQSALEMAQHFPSWQMIALQNSCQGQNSYWPLAEGTHEILPYPGCIKKKKGCKRAPIMHVLSEMQLCKLEQRPWGDLNGSFGAMFGQDCGS